MQTLITPNWCYEGETMLLPPWTILHPGGVPQVVAAVSTLTFTIYRTADNSTVGAIDRNGKNANGVTIDSSGRVHHLVPVDDNAVAITYAPELRRIVYTITFTADSTVRKVGVEYLIRPCHL